MSNHRSYPAYKPSGVPWLGDVPEHWEVWRLKQVCSDAAIYGANIPATRYQAEGTRFLRTTDIADDGSLNAEGVFLPPELVDDYVLSDGDILLSRSGTVGRSFLYSASLHGPCAYAGYLVRFVPSSFILPKYLFLFTKTSAFSSFLRTMAISSTIENVNAEKYANGHVPLPPLPEQAAIVRYLGHVDRRIRRYVTAKRKLIALLEEERQAVVNQAVTRGLDPSVRLKPSGVEWLGDVPAHWETMRARFLFKEVNLRSTTGKETHLSMSQALGLVPSHLVEQSLISDSYVGGKLCGEGDLVLNRLKAHLGVFALARQAGVISPDYSVFRKRGSVKMAYFEMVFRLPALRTELRIRAKGIVEGFWRLYTEDLFDIRLPVPSFTEQQAIVKHLDRATADIDAATARAHRQIELVHEYRTRLIADVVTGKLDVREAAAQLSGDDLLPSERHPNPTCPHSQT